MKNKNAKKFSNTRNDEIKPYWVILQELDKDLDTLINSPITTEYCNKGTVSRLQGKIIGYNMKHKDIITYKQTQEHTLRHNRGEILMYESCLYNLPYNNYENIRSIFINMWQRMGYNIYYRY